MSKMFIENQPKIYLKDSDKARLADRRVRIIREKNPHEPCDNECLVFEKAESKDGIPKHALYSWKFQPYTHCTWFFTTAERCEKMVSEDPSYWTKEKLKEFANIEHKLYEDWFSGHVYGYVVEQWDEKNREWIAESSLWGMYGAEELMHHLAEETDGIGILICVDEEEMKYEFDNVEFQRNQFI
jgi:hypothetical protein